MAELNSLLSTILEKQIPQREQLQRENERNRRFGTIRQGSILDSIPNIIRPEFFKPEANIDPTTGAPEKNFGHFLTSGFGNTASNTASGVDALTMLLLAGGGAKLGSKFLKGLGEKGAFDASSINKIIERILKTRGKRTDITSGLADKPVPNSSPNRSGFFSQKPNIRELEDFKMENLKFDDQIANLKGRFAQLTDPNTGPFRKREAFKILKNNKRLSNSILEGMSLEDQKQVRRVLQKLREKNG